MKGATQPQDMKANDEHSGGGTAHHRTGPYRGQKHLSHLSSLKSGLVQIHTTQDPILAPIFPSSLLVRTGKRDKPPAFEGALLCTFPARLGSYYIHVATSYVRLDKLKPRRQISDNQVLTPFLSKVSLVKTSNGCLRPCGVRCTYCFILLAQPCRNM